ncbi:hypothetical protein OJF2_04800 [Aquisphaera giovannonii]|uniref:Uncharacterized protein n=1 Tax=Aquisphaera giovannonii TaxID=406548 RepID=A0A5B9VVX3_9BACT|nr:hypothetical protein [Aquisphaera giovannonii]QEH32011.1 hypothetical protein OJF2_04800 [Aquisphaera giovannonii]
MERRASWMRSFCTPPMAILAVASTAGPAAAADAARIALKVKAGWPASYEFQGVAPLQRAREDLAQRQMQQHYLATLRKLGIGSGSEGLCGKSDVPDSSTSPLRHGHRGPAGAARPRVAKRAAARG